MISEKLFTKLNNQTNFEFYSAHVYLAMAAYCAAQDLKGFENFFLVQEQEEKFHAMKFYNYINDMNGRVYLAAVDAPQNHYESLLDVFKKALEHEHHVTERIYCLTDIATEEREHATISFLKWFIDEQVEEQATFSSLVKRLERIGKDSSALYQLDAELAQRVFTPPANA